MRRLGSWDFPRFPDFDEPDEPTTDEEDAYDRAVEVQERQYELETMDVSEYDPTFSRHAQLWNPEVNW